MSLILVQAGLLVLIAATLMALALVAFDRWAPSRLVRERHDLALAIWIALPFVLVLALQPRAEVEPAVEPTPVMQAINTDEAQRLPDTLPVAAPPQNRDLSAVSLPRWTRLPWADLAVVAWLGGAALGFFGIVLDLVSLLRLRVFSRATGLPTGLRLSRAVPLRRSDSIQTPMLAGYLRPSIYVPQDFKLDAQARPVLEHEIAHLVRGDAWTVLGLRMLRAALWWVLPLRQVERLLEENREALCDERAARVTGEPVALAHALLDAAEVRIRRPGLALAAGSAKSGLTRRIRYLASPDILSKRSTPMRLALILPMIAATAFIATPRVGAISGEDYDFNDDQNDVSVLYQASRRGRINEIAALIDAGADPNEISWGDGTPLIAAIRTGQMDVVEYLLSRGADPNIAVSGDGSAMIEAASRGRADILEVLMAEGGDIDAGVEGDGNPLIAAVQSGQLATVDYLLEAGANPNAYIWGDETPMVAAAQEGHVMIAERLVEAGADLSLTVLASTRNGDEYRSPISEAERLGRDRMLDWLRDHGAEHRPPSEQD